MSNYKNILNVQSAEYNKIYKSICKEKPSLSLKDKSSLTLKIMINNRGLNALDLFTIIERPYTKEFQYGMEVVALNDDIENGINGGEQNNIFWILKFLKLNCFLLVILTDLFHL